MYIGCGSSDLYGTGEQQCIWDARAVMFMERESSNVYGPPVVPVSSIYLLTAGYLCQIPV